MIVKKQSCFPPVDVLRSKTDAARKRRGCIDVLAQVVIKPSTRLALLRQTNVDVTHVNQISAHLSDSNTANISWIAMGPTGSVRTAVDGRADHEADTGQDGKLEATIRLDAYSNAAHKAGVHRFVVKAACRVVDLSTAVRSASMLSRLTLASNIDYSGQVPDMHTAAHRVVSEAMVLNVQPIDDVCTSLHRRLH